MNAYIVHKIYLLIEMRHQNQIFMIINFWVPQNPAYAVFPATKNGEPQVRLL